MFYSTQILLVIVLLKIVEYVNWVWWVWIEVSVNCGWGLVWWSCEQCGGGLCWGVWNVCRCCPHVWCLRFCHVSAVIFIPVSARQLRALLIREYPWFCFFCFLFSPLAFHSLLLRFPWCWPKENFTFVSPHILVVQFLLGVCMRSLYFSYLGSWKSTVQCKLRS